MPEFAKIPTGPQGPLQVEASVRQQRSGKRLWEISEGDAVIAWCKKHHNTSEEAIAALNKAKKKWNFDDPVPQPRA